MSRAGVLRDRGKHGYAWWCPGCECFHGTEGWQFNGNVDKPTFTPSFLVTSGHYLANHDPEKDCWCDFNTKYKDDPYWKGRGYSCIRCHTYITDGKIQYLGDTTHELVGQTIDMYLPEDRQDPEEA